MNINIRHIELLGVFGEEREKGVGGRSCIQEKPFERRIDGSIDS